MDFHFSPSESPQTKNRASRDFANVEKQRRKPAGSGAAEVKMAENPKVPKTPRMADVWAVQCDRCFKWRIIPTQEEFEEIRSKFIEEPFHCSKKPGAFCDDAGGDIEYDASRTWLADKPNIPKTPVGFKRELVLRSDYTKMDAYYHAPTGKKLRSAPQIASFLSDNPEFKHLSVSDFSFVRPKILADIIPNHASPEEKATPPPPPTPETP
ncbi:OLC1v1007417C1 [Oldenlandia corymbosa var. corymbosa]|uniref:OLC1v1007417C1 n=1 Tax=Oldenlandia corymbosa var. corymbosa TaxID=529605 RepID=A0AAV1DJ52_OLDCO|nr:OLC1v1007417C1 [Oldenlandia corymbosa var. corymbosa]